MTKIRISAIVSTYNAEKFFRSRIENLCNQTIADALEIIVIDSGSAQREAEILNEIRENISDRGSFAPQLKYLRTERETLYAAWNRGVGMAQGVYISNANTDDRLLDNAYEKMTLKLDETPEAVLAYSDAWETTDESEILDCVKLEYKPGRRRVYQPEYSHNKLLLHCYCGPFPMWRRSVHDKFGYFDPKFVVSGDWEFWLRMAEQTNFVHLAEPLGLMLRRDDSIVWSNQEKMLEENNIIRLKYFGQSQNDR
ncbi:MAG TPA: glycosyltransferase [Drouetiella sp.]|jgi:O-antigen biosynthesis protein